jgi:hypothetical protein
VTAVSSRRELREAFSDIIEGRTVKRSKHILLWESRDVSSEFIKALDEHGYLPMRVQDADVQPGERVPAFVIQDATAYFGWVFWEKFSTMKLRKLFGTTVRNTKGDWAIQIPEGRNTVLHVNMRLRTGMDIDNPSGF